MMFYAGEDNVLGSENPHGSSVFRQHYIRRTSKPTAQGRFNGFIFSSEEAAVPEGEVGFVSEIGRGQSGGPRWESDCGLARVFVVFLH